jgi:hypothetical protein
VYFNYYLGGATWNHYGTIAINIANASGEGYGTCGANVLCYFKHRSLISCCRPGVYYHAGGGTWNHIGIVTTTVTNTTGAGHGTQTRPMHCNVCCIHRWLTFPVQVCILMVVVEHGITVVLSLSSSPTLQEKALVHAQFGEVQLW